MPDRAKKVAKTYYMPADLARSVSVRAAEEGVRPCQVVIRALEREFAATAVRPEGGSHDATVRGR